MTTIRSARAKGKKMEREVRDKIIEALNLSANDVVIPVGAENGPDVKLSPKARTVFPFSVEIKRRKSFDTLYKFYNQAKGHYKDLIPLVIMRADYNRPLAMLDLDHLLTIVEAMNNNKKDNTNVRQRNTSKRNPTD